MGSKDYNNFVFHKITPDFVGTRIAQTDFFLQMPPETQSAAVGRVHKLHAQLPWTPTPTVLKPEIGFGALVEVPPPVAPAQLLAPELSARLRSIWREHGGLLVLRGLTLRGLTPDGLLELSAVFGVVEEELDASKVQYEVPTAEALRGSVMRIGNVRREADGELVAINAVSAPLPPGGDPVYNTETGKPVWHTDSLYRERPPIGSVFFCKVAPPTGAATCFADTAAGAHHSLISCERTHTCT